MLKASINAVAKDIDLRCAESGQNLPGAGVALKVGLER